MKKTINALKLSVICSIIVSSFLACDKDFASVESDVLSEKNTNLNTSKETLQILAYNKKLDSLQIDGLPSTLLGVFNDPTYGQTTASIITQIAPSTFSPKFGDNPVIDSVVMTIPYFSRIVNVDETGNIYAIDSLYGDAPIKLTVFKNDYFLRNFDPNAPLGETQHYYSKADREINDTDNFALNGTSTINFDDHKHTNDTILKINSFIPDPERIRLDTKDENGDLASTNYIAPAIRYKLDTEFWKTTIIDKGNDNVLSSASNFSNYFRGLYFKTEAINNEGSMVLLNLASTEAKIVIYYSNDSSTQSTYTLTFTGKRLNTLINNYNLIDLENGDKELGDEKLYLKGAEGSMAVIDLFHGQVEYEGEMIDALDAFKNKYRILLDDSDGEGKKYKTDKQGNYVLKRLINDAILTVYEDETMDADFHEYDRIFAYDIKNNIPLVDYSVDPIAINSDPYNSKIIHLGQRKTNDNGLTKYKIRITEHLNNILLRDSTNTKIGLTLSTNVNATTSAEILDNTATTDTNEIKVTGVPSASIITPRGTVLYGTNTDGATKMKLEIFFTEPK